MTTEEKQQCPDCGEWVTDMDAHQVAKHDDLWDDE